MRPIDADALKESVENLFCEKCYERGGAFCADCALHYLIQYSDKLPTLTLDDLRPKGKWVKNGWNDYSCSKCETQYVGKGALAWNYCPHCGARLGGGK